MKATHFRTPLAFGNGALRAGRLRRWAAVLGRAALLGLLVVALRLGAVLAAGVAAVYAATVVDGAAGTLAVWLVATAAALALPPVAFRRLAGRYGPPEPPAGTAGNGRAGPRGHRQFETTHGHRVE